MTDRRTDRHRVTAIAALCIASHGKNEVKLAERNAVQDGHSCNGMIIGNSYVMYQKVTLPVTLNV